MLKNCDCYRRKCLQNQRLISNVLEEVDVASNLSPVTLALDALRALNLPPQTYIYLDTCKIKTQIRHGVEFAIVRKRPFK